MFYRRLRVNNFRRKKLNFQHFLPHHNLATRMEREYLIAITGGIFTVIAPLLTLVITRYYDNKSYSSSGGKRNLSGDWKGATTQSNGKSVIVTGSIKSKIKTLTGIATVTHGNSSISVKLKGFYLDETHIQLNYVSSNEMIKNFGSQILKINANCTKLTGLTVGFGNEAEEIISGVTILEKVR